MKKVFIFIPLFFFFSCVYSQTIVSVVPDEAEQGDELEITITGEDTQWTQGTNVLFFKQGSETIYPSPQTVVSDIVIKGFFYFNSGDETGLYDVRVENWSTGDDVVLEDGFTLIEGLEGSITSVVPDSAHQVEALTVTITGENTNFLQGSTILKFTNYEATIYPQSQNIISNTVIEGDFLFNTDHPVDDYNVIVTHTTGYIALVDGFYLSAALVLPELESIAPDTAEQEETVTITISGQDTHFDYPGINNEVKLTGNALIYGYDINVIDNTTLEATFTFTYYHSTGNYNVKVFNQLDGTLTLEDAFTLETGPNAPGIVMVEPDSAMQTEEVWITVTGENVDFEQSSPTLYLHQENGSIIFPVDQNVINDTVVEGDFFFNPNQNTGFYDVKVGNTVAFLADGFYLSEPENYPGTPSNEPNTGNQNEPVILTVTVDYAHFDHPDLETTASLINRDDGIDAESVTVIDSNVIEAEFLFNSSHSPGIYNLKLFNLLDGTMWHTDAFTLESDTNSVQITEVSPDNSEQGESLWITVTGQNTSFNTGSATIKFMQGSSTIIYPYNENIINDTEIEGDFTFTTNDPVGYYDVYVYDENGNWSVNKENGFLLQLPVSIGENNVARLGKVYPNPANEILFIERGPNNTKGIAIDILNLAGEIIHINEMTSNQNTKKIDVSGFDSGVYLIKLRSETEVVIEKIVIR